MEIETDVNTYIKLKDIRGDVENSFTFIFAKAGTGKTLSIESLIEEYKKLGYTILILSDVKDEFEMGFALFEPRKPYHIYHLRKIGKPIQKQEVKLYHPFSFRIPTNSALPEINFYGFSIKELRRNEWSMIAESSMESDTIRLLLNACNSISNSDGLYSFLHFVEESVIGKREKRKINPDPKNFYLRTATATAKSLQDISSYLIPFKEDYFLVPNNSQLKLDWKTILNDNDCYHVFTTYWIQDEKLKDFTILALFNSILRNKQYARKPILIVIPEIRFLTPFKPEGYKKYLADGIKSNLSVMRNMGRGFSGIFDSQVWQDVSEDVRNSATFTCFGELGGAGDIEKISKAMNYKRDIRDMLKKMDYRNSYLIQGKEELGSFTLWFPSHMHKEPEYNFFEMYKTHYPERMKNYKELYEKIRKEYEEEEDTFREKVKKRMQEEERLENEKIKQREYKSSEKLKEAEDEVKALKKMKVDEKKEALYKEKIDNPNKSFRTLGDRYGISHITAKKYFDDVHEKKKSEALKQDIEPINPNGAGGKPEDSV
jgi:hypothetical protein